MTLEDLEESFSLISSSDSSWRDNAKVWYDYYVGNQWTSEEVSALQDRGQAVTTYNHIAPAIDAIIGGERQNRPDIRMAGRTMDDEQIAEVKTNLYKYIEYGSNTDDELDKAFLDGVIVGRGVLYVKPLMDGDNFVDIKHQYIDYRDIYIDQFSKRDDLTDAMFIHQAVFVDSDMLKKMFPQYKCEESTEEVFDFGSNSEEDIYFDKANRKRLRLITTWSREDDGEITVDVWVKGQKLYSKKSPYSIKKFPYAVFTYKRDLENKPYGIVKSMISAQDEVNKRHSKALHYLNAKQVLAEENAFVDWTEAKKALAKPDGIVKLADGTLAEGRVQMIDNTQLAASHIQMMEHAKSQITALAGINSSYVGQGSQYESAKKANIAIGQAQSVLVPMLNKFRIMRHELAEITMRLVPDFYTEERILRIVEPSGEYAFMPVNQIGIAQDGSLQKVNDISLDDVDIIIEDAPAGLNDREEQFAKLLQIQGQTARPIPMEILLRYTSLKNKKQLAAELQQHYAMEAQLQQAQQVIEQLQGQIQQMGGQVQQVESQLVQANVARAVDKEVAKAKGEIEKEKNAIKDQM